MLELIFHNSCTKGIQKERGIHYQVKEKAKRYLEIRKTTMVKALQKSQCSHKQPGTVLVSQFL